jgi:hypothetical protein
MKKLGIISIICLAIFLLAAPVSVFAGDAEDLPAPGLTPDSPFYFMDRWMQQINLAFTFNQEAKVQKSLLYAEERLAELKAMAEKNDTKAAEEAANQYQNCLNVATQDMNNALDKGTGAAEQVTAIMAKHIAIMSRVQNAGENQSLMQQACEQSSVCLETTLRALAGKDPEKALQINTRLMEAEKTRLNNSESSNNGTQNEQGLKLYEKLQTMNREILKQAERSGKTEQTQGAAGQSSGNQNQVSSTVRQETQTSNQGDTPAPVQVTQTEQEKLSSGSGNGEQSTTTPTAKPTENEAKPSPTNNQETSPNGPASPESGAADDEDSETNDSSTKSGSGNKSSGGRN